MSTLAPPPPAKPKARPKRPAPPDAKLPMTEAEFEVWVESQEHVRAEWADGEVFDMGDASFDHNDLQGWIFMVVRGFVKARRLGVVCWENRMRLADPRRHRLPDVYFVAEARRGIIGTARIEGPVDLAVEVVSPEYAEHDYVTKFREYERAGVREYWIVDPQNRTFAAYHLAEDGRYAPVEPDAEGKVHSPTLPGLWLRPADLFAAERPAELSVLAELGIP